MSGHPESLPPGMVVEPGSEFTLETTRHGGKKVATLASVRAAILSMAGDYDRDGESAVALAFRMFAESFVDEFAPAPPAVTHTGPPA